VVEVLAPLGGCIFTPRLTATLYTAEVRPGMKLDDGTVLVVEPA
jgi:hypothetical protein